MTDSNVIVITGASSGIGLATVERALQAGFRVIATVRSEHDELRLQRLGAEVVRVEFADEDSVSRAAADILVLAGEPGIAGLFNNAGYGLQVAMEDSDSQSLALQHRVNVIAPIQLTNLLLPALGAGSKLIFNGSILGLISVAFRGPYCMSKHALEAAADTYRLELAPLGIDVHLLEPGPISASFRPNALRALRSLLGERAERGLTRLDYSGHLARLNNPNDTLGTLPADSCAQVVMALMTGRHKRYRNPVTKTAKTMALLKRLLGSGFHRLAMKAEPVIENRRG